MRRPRHDVAALLVFVAAFALYAATSAPGLLFGDSAELQAAAITGGIPHATGYPAFVLFGRLFSGLTPGDPARAINLMSGFFGAAALGLMVVTLGELGVGPVAAAASALTFGLSFTPWRTSLRAEVYGLAVALAVLALWRVLVARRSGRFGHILLAGFLLGLTLTGHLAFAPMVAILGLMLAWQVARRESQPLGKLVLLAMAFVLGLTPYLWIAWADMHHAAINYFDLVRAVKNPLGHPMPDFDTPWKRLVWILTGRNQYPTIPIPADLRAGLATSVEAFFILFLFELGPIAGLLSLVGLVKLWRRDRAFTAILVLAFVVAVTFASFLQSRAMLHIFLLPAMVLLTLAVGAGVEAVVGRMPGAARAIAAAVLAALMIVPGPFIREYAEAHPFTKWKFHVEEEDQSLRASWFPTMRTFREADRYREAAVAAIPESALVLAGWSELNVLRYAQAVRGERKDLTLQQITPETLAQRMEMWQRSHDVARRPFVFTELPEGLPPMLRNGDNPSWHAVLERIPLDWDRAIYIQRISTDTSGTSPLGRLGADSRAPADLVIRVTFQSFERSVPGFVTRLRDGSGSYAPIPWGPPSAGNDSLSFAVSAGSIDSIWNALQREHFFRLASVATRMYDGAEVEVTAVAGGTSYSVFAQNSPYPPLEHIIDVVRSAIPDSISRELRGARKSAPQPRPS